MAAPNAWILDLGTSFRAAIGSRELVQIVEAPTTFLVPLTPTYSRHVVFWQKRMVPVMDLSIRLGGPPTEHTLLALVGYQDPCDQTVGVGAIVLATPPVRITVNDSQATALDQQGPCWKELAISCFERDGMVIPVLHLSRMFGIGMRHN